jgi:peptidoglycan/LPS O-acetylase OafA/YrhL
MHSFNSSKNEYRADIDGIRSLAVLSVFFFHLQPSLLPGGFLGVDVFFVISGYLITGIIIRENHLRTFSFIHFYTRRVKRIFPALFVVLLLSAFVATFLLPPATYDSFMKSARYASGQLANFFFSREVGYFNEGFSGQPLLHTWSLGVEEQFYLFWPLLIYFCFWLFNTSKASQVDKAPAKPPNLSAAEESISGKGGPPGAPFQSINKKIAGVMLLLSLVSFMVCCFLAEANYNLAFYMFYTRALEFCIGGFISLKILPSPKAETSNNLLGALGILLLCYSFMFVKEEYLGLSFLQFGVLLPCVGTALVIHANWEKGIINKILATKVPVSIGKISYSLYLYHWPVIIFWKIYSNTHEISIIASLGIIFVSFIFSILSFLFVEQPARKSRLPDRRILALASAVVIVCAVSFKNLENYETASWRITSYINEKSPPPKQYSPGCHKEEKDGLEYYTCNEGKESEPPIVAIVGDSHSPHFLYSTTVWAEKNGYDVKFNVLGACPILLGDIRIESTFGDKHEEDCRRQVSLFQTEIVDDPRVEIVLLAHRFDLFHTGISYANKTRPIVSFKNSDGRKVKDHTGYYRARLAATIDTIRAKGKELIILKQVPIFDGANDCDWEPRIKKLLNKERVCNYDLAFFNKWQQPSIDFINEFAATHNVPVLDPVPFFERPLHEGVNLYEDSDHLNEYGKQFLVPYFVKAMDEIMADYGKKPVPVI